MSPRAWPTPGITFWGELPLLAQKTPTLWWEAPRPPTASVTWAIRDRTEELVQHAMQANTKMLRDRPHAHFVLMTPTPMSVALYRVIAPVTWATRAQTEEPAQPVTRVSIKMPRDPPHALVARAIRFRIQQVLRYRTASVPKAFRDQTAGRALPVLRARIKKSRDLQIVWPAPTTAIPLPKVRP